MDEKYTLEIAGTGITDTDVNAVSVTIGGLAQTVTSVSSTLIVAEIVDLKKGITADELKVILTEGIVGGYADLLPGVTFTPKFESVSTNVVALAGSTIRAYVPGVGTEDSVTIVKEGRAGSFCQAKRIPEYGVVECDMNPSVGWTVAAQPLQIRDDTNAVNYDCDKTDILECALTFYRGAEAISSTTQTLLSTTQI